jgi:predicted lysophospholipase L1 biosynthesis ABC-type transport system permease subunit
LNEGEILHEPAGRGTADTVAGYLAAIAIFVSVVGIAWHPLRLILPSTAIALIASGMSNSRRQLTLMAVLICAVCLFLGLTVAVATSHPLW